MADKKTPRLHILKTLKDFELELRKMYNKLLKHAILAPVNIHH